MVKTENFEKVLVSSTAELRQWLTDNHGQKESVWLVTYKKQVEDKYISTQEVLDELLCFGWIDGIRRKLNEDQTMQLIAPRQAEHWTKTYKDRFAKLEAAGLMTDAGRKEVIRSKANGSWHFMDDVDQLIKPKDLIDCLELHAPALSHFNKFSPSSQRFILRWIKLAKTDATRQKRILEASVLAKENKKILGL